MNSPASEMSARKTFEQWFSEGESIYAELLKELQAMEAQMTELQGRIRQKRAQADQIARVLGKAPAEPSRPAAHSAPPAPTEAVTVDEALRIRLPYGKPPAPRPPRSPGTDAVVVPLRE